jgi:hypothetical protein
MNITKSDDKFTLQTARYAHAAATDGKLIYVFADPLLEILPSSTALV